MTKKQDQIQKLKTKFNLEESKTLDEAVKILPELSISKFVGSISVDIILGLKEKEKKESIKGTILFPNKFIKEVKVVVLADENDAKLALKAGALEAGLDDLMKKIEDNELEFDILIATPKVMPKIAKLGKVLGPKGLMPNPKNGTVSNQIEKTVSEFVAGKTTFEMKSKSGSIKSKIGNLNMKPEEIKANLTAFFKAVHLETKRFNSNPFKKVILNPTMGPGIKLDINDIINNI